MIGDFLARILEGLLQPRISARRILAANLKADAAIMMLVLAYVVQAILQIVLPGARPLPEGVSGVPIGLHFFNILLQIIMVGVLAMMIYGFGRLFGGAGTRLQSFVIVAWHTLVTTVLAPVFIYGMAQLSGGTVPAPTLLLMLIAAGAWMWLLACYTTELHGFRSAWGPMGMMIAASFLFSMLFVNMIPAA